ncbi:hypothetical protein Tco_0366934 [Tanacetum coccineum]
MDESISVSSIIDQTSNPHGMIFQLTLKTHKDELSLVQLGSHFRIEETLRAEESGKGKGKEIDGSSSLNMIEDDDVFAFGGLTLVQPFHALSVCCWFDTFHLVQDGSMLHMGDESTKPILGRGNVVLELSSRKTITLVNVVYVPGLRIQ